MCAGMSAGTGRASGVGLGAITCATVHFLIAVLRRRVATVDLARLVSCAACPSDRLELHLDIEGAEYEVCQVPSLFAVHTHTDHTTGAPPSFFCFDLLTKVRLLLWQVLRHLLARGVACRFRSMMAVEWHETSVRSRAAALRERQGILTSLRACGVRVVREVR